MITIMIREEKLLRLKSCYFDKENRSNKKRGKLPSISDFATAEEENRPHRHHHHRKIYVECLVTKRHDCFRLFRRVGNICQSSQAFQIKISTEQVSLDKILIYSPKSPLCNIALSKQTSLSSKHIYIVIY